MPFVERVFGMRAQQARLQPKKLWGGERMMLRVYIQPLARQGTKGQGELEMRGRNRRW